VSNKFAQEICKGELAMSDSDLKRCKSQNLPFSFSSSLQYLKVALVGTPYRLVKGSEWGRKIDGEIGTAG
jgi:hypothetical protein